MGPIKTSTISSWPSREEFQCMGAPKAREWKLKWFKIQERPYEAKSNSHLRQTIPETTLRPCQMLQKLWTSQMQTWHLIWPTATHLRVSSEKICWKPRSSSYLSRNLKEWNNCGKGPLESQKSTRLQQAVKEPHLPWLWKSGRVLTRQLRLMSVNSPAI